MPIATRHEAGESVSRSQVTRVAYTALVRRLGMARDCRPNRPATTHRGSSFVEIGTFAFLIRAPRAGSY